MSTSIYTFECRYFCEDLIKLKHAHTLQWPLLTSIQDSVSSKHHHAYTCIHHRIQLAVGDMTMSGWKPTISPIHPPPSISSNNVHQVAWHAVNQFFVPHLKLRSILFKELHAWPNSLRLALAFTLGSIHISTYISARHLCWGLWRINMWMIPSFWKCGWRRSPSRSVRTVRNVFG